MMTKIALCAAQKEKHQMELTEQQKRMIFHMKKHHMSIDEMTAVLMHIESNLQQKTMIEYLLNHTKESLREIVDKAIEISKITAE